MDRLKVSSVLLVVIGVAVIAIGVMYISTPRIMSYHENFIGMTHEEIIDINPRLADMMLVLLKGIGVCSIGLGILGIAVSVKIYREGEKWAWYAMLVIGGTVVIGGQILFVTTFSILPGILDIILAILWIVGMALPAKEILS
ncbi:MAG: hypothetical protein ACETV1_07025 [Candidatus Bathyarchaeia archaeon]